MKVLLALLLLAFGLFRAPAAATNGAPVKLAIISESPDAADVAAVLTVEFTKHDGVQLLERAEIERVYREQGLSAANRDYIKLGRILGADGLLLLGTAAEGTNQFLNVRLVAVKPGVVLMADRFSWPITNLMEWAAPFVMNQDVFLPKLAVLAKDAIPISVVNLRAAVASGEASETERELKTLTIQRLSREPQLFVLERQHLELLGGEKELSSDESAFWDGSYLLEGVVDQNGYARDTVTINARLTPPRGGQPLLFEASGGRTNLAEAVNALAVKVTELLKINPVVTEWNAADEASQYYTEARWALRWRSYPEAQEASESAWALGLHTDELALLRLQSYLEAAPGYLRWGPERYFYQTPDPADLHLANRLMDLFSQGTRIIMAEPGATDLVPVSYNEDVINGATSVTKLFPRAFSSHVDWFTRGLMALNISDAVLQAFNESAEARQGNELQLSEIRALTRQVKAQLEQYTPADRAAFGNSEYDLNTLKWADGGLWYDTPEEGLLAYRQMLQSGLHPYGLEMPSSLDDDGGDLYILPHVVAWSWEDRKRIPDLLRRLAKSLAGSTNQDLQLDGLLYTLVLTPNDSSGRLAAAQSELFDRIWEQRRSLFDERPEADILRPIEESLCLKFGKYHGNINQGPFFELRQRLRDDYIANATHFGGDGFQPLFSGSSPGNGYALGGGSKPDMDHWIAQLEDLKKQRPFAARDLRTVDQKIDELKWMEQNLPHARQIPPVDPVSNPANAVVVNFTPWNLDLPDMDPGVHAVAKSAIFRQGKLWVQVRRVNPGYDVQVFFAGVDLRTGLSETIPLPPNSGSPSQAFEVTADAIFVVLGNQLERYSFRTKQWGSMHIPLQGNPQVLELGGRIYLANSDAILEVTPATQSIQVLASIRRRPALNQLDEESEFGKIYAEPNGDLVVLAKDRAFVYSPGSRAWTSPDHAPAEPILWHGKYPIGFDKDGQAIDPFAEPEDFHFVLPWSPPQPKPKPFTVDTPDGRVMIAPWLIGHWFIPKTALASSLAELRNFLLTNRPAVQK